VNERQAGGIKHFDGAIYFDLSSAIAAKQINQMKNAAKLNANSSFCRPLGARRVAAVFSGEIIDGSSG
jgi:hypothetical protein